MSVSIHHRVKRGKASDETSEFFTIAPSVLTHATKRHVNANTHAGHAGRRVDPLAIEGGTAAARASGSGHIGVQHKAVDRAALRQQRREAFEAEMNAIPDLTTTQMAIAEAEMTLTFKRGVAAARLTDTSHVDTPPPHRHHGPMFRIRLHRYRAALATLTHVDEVAGVLQTHRQHMYDQHPNLQHVIAAWRVLQPAPSTAAVAAGSTEASSDDNGSDGGIDGGNGGGIDSGSDGDSNRSSAAITHRIAHNTNDNNDDVHDDIVIERFDSDGERGAGERLMYALQKAELINVIVCVCVFYPTGARDQQPHKQRLGYIVRCIKPLCDDFVTAMTMIARTERQARRAKEEEDAERAAAADATFLTTNDHDDENDGESGDVFGNDDNGDGGRNTNDIDSNIMNSPSSYNDHGADDVNINVDADDGTINQLVVLGAATEHARDEKHRHRLMAEIEYYKLLYAQWCDIQEQHAATFATMSSQHLISISAGSVAALTSPSHAQPHFLVRMTMVCVGVLLRADNLSWPALQALLSRHRLADGKVTDPLTVWQSWRAAVGDVESECTEDTAARSVDDRNTDSPDSAYHAAAAAHAELQAERATAAAEAAAEAGADHEETEENDTDPSRPLTSSSSSSLPPLPPPPQPVLPQQRTLHHLKMHVVHRLCSVNLFNIADDQIARVREILREPECTPAAVAAISTAAGTLLAWVMFVLEARDSWRVWQRQNPQLRASHGKLMTVMAELRRLDAEEAAAQRAARGEQQLQLQLTDDNDDTGGDGEQQQQEQQEQRSIDDQHRREYSGFLLKYDNA